MGRASAKDFSTEMYYEALHFSSLAQLESDDVLKRRYSRFAIISYATSFEALLNYYLRKETSELKGNQYRDVFNYLQYGRPQYEPPHILNTVRSKIELLGKLTKGESKIVLDSFAFKQFEEDIIHLRNNILHYAHGNFSEVYGATLHEAAAKGASALQHVLAEMKENLNVIPPSFFGVMKVEVS
ncbi:hypothetical protein GCM10007425_11960 [Lysinibacillus alkalisoli]|uniref:RiboL-PSP-HEPN domain-containing protein n=1 Tax=Lysinibacillus alkalisoli TaxID=1911548 RepID=A0A917G2S1_9BACI|nr:hypothetical protein [Lysinibacillus alkalisoli]GGG19026.1 hypothetical protein GCM10007425_11960 [Lysinibacillus alkalisoli]